VGLPGAEESIDERRLADVRAAEKGDLGCVEGLGDGGEVGYVRRGEQEYRGESHRSSLADDAGRATRLVA